MAQFGLLPYLGGSALGMAATASHAFYTHEQFYPACIYLTSGKLHQLVVCNFLVAFSICFGIFLKKLALGALRASEVENLMDRLWPTIFDTLLLTTIFRGELTSDFFVLFGVLVFVSIFHWIVKDRVDYIATSPAISVVQYVRLATLIGALLLFDAAYVYYVYSKVTMEGPSYVLLFGFEYALLLSTMISITLKFCFNVVDTRMQGQWHNKAIYVLGTEFMEETQKFLTLIAFFITVQAYYGVPLHILRRLIVSYRLFQKRFAEVVNYVRLARNMNQLVVNASREELENADSMCVICREDMVEGKKLPCGHIFHGGCLRGWLGRSHECPTCRHSLLPHLQQNRRGRRQRGPEAAQRQAELMAAQRQHMEQQQRLMMIQQQFEQQQRDMMQRHGGLPAAPLPHQQPQMQQQQQQQLPLQQQQPQQEQQQPLARQEVIHRNLGLPSPSIDQQQARQEPHRQTQQLPAPFSHPSAVDPVALLGTVSEIQSHVAQLAAQLAGLQATLEQQMRLQAAEAEAAKQRAAAAAEAAATALEASREAAKQVAEAQMMKREVKMEAAEESVQQAETEIIAAPASPAREREGPPAEASPTAESAAEIRQRRLLRFSSEA